MKEPDNGLRAANVLRKAKKPDEGGSVGPNGFGGSVRTVSKM